MCLLSYGFPKIVVVHTKDYHKNGYAETLGTPGNSVNKGSTFPPSSPTHLRWWWGKTAAS